MSSETPRVSVIARQIGDVWRIDHFQASKVD
jgi:hypothetical protein